MPRETDKLVTVIEVDDRGSAKIRKHTDEMERMGRRGGRSLKDLKAGYLAATAAVVAFGAALNKVVSLAAEQERVERRLAFAVQQQGLAVDRTTKHLLKYASALQQQTVYGDEAIISVQTMLAQLGNLSGTELDKATRLTLDFASAMGVDLKAAAILMGKAAAGSTEALSRYGIILDENIPETEKFTELLGLMQRKFGGTARAETDTLYGSIMQFKNALGDVGEEMGRANDGWLKTAFKFWGNLATNVASAMAGMRDIQNLSIKGKLEQEIADLEKKLALYSGGSDLYRGRTYGMLSQITEKRRMLAALSPKQLGEKTVPPAPEAAPEATRGAGFDSTYWARQDLQVQALLETQAALRTERTQEEVEVHRHAAEDAMEIYDMQRQAELDYSNFLISESQRRMQAKQDEVQANIEATRMGFQALATMFPKMKAFAIGEAIVSTHQAITNALATKPFVPVGLAMAALAAAKGFASVRAIQDQGISTGGGTSTYAVGSAQLPVQPRQKQDITLEISGADEMVDKGAFGEKMLAMLGQMLQATGGHAGNIRVVYTD